MYPTSNNPEILVGQCTTVTTLKEITTSSWFLSPPEVIEPPGLEDVEENPEYEFVSDQATNACGTHGAKRVSLSGRTNEYTSVT